MRFSWLAFAFVLSACGRGRVTAAQSPFDPCYARACGGVINVVTDLAPGTPLTSEECAEACAALWCGQTPAETPGCTLEGDDDIGQPTVKCGPLADCNL